METRAHVQPVRGALSSERSDRILAFWEAHGALVGAAAQQRLPEVVCVLLDGDDVVGVNSVHAADVRLVGGRRFWLYRRFLSPDLTDPRLDADMVNAAFDVLDVEHTPGDSPVGIGVIVAPRDLERVPPDLVWPDTHLFHAGFLPDGSQLRVRYFDGALVA